MPRVPGQTKEVTKTVDATIKGITPQALLVEVEGQTGPVPLDGNSQLVVVGKVEREFLQAGSSVMVSGYVREGGRLTDAIVTLHVQPQQTMSGSAVRQVKQTNPLVTAAGQIVSLDPLRVRITDGLQLVGEQTQPNVPPPTSQPQYNQILTLELKSNDATIAANFGANAALIPENASAKLTVPENGQPVVRRVVVTREEPITREDLQPKKNSKRSKKANAE